MHWVTILSMLACAMASTYLVFVEGWDRDMALFIVAGGGIGVSGTLLGIVWFICDPTERREFQRLIRTIAIEDLKGFLRALRPKP